MQMAGRFARRVNAWASANGVPVIFRKTRERKHLIAEQYLEENSVSPRVFLILAAKAPASVWKVHRSARGVISRLEKKREHVYHYSFHIMDPALGHLVIKMSGHPPFGAQVILNGHEYVAVAPQVSPDPQDKRGGVTVDEHRVCAFRAFRRVVCSGCRRVAHGGGARGAGIAWMSLACAAGPGEGMGMPGTGPGG